MPTPQRTSMMWSFVFTCLLGLLHVVLAKSSHGDSVLVVLEPTRQKAEFQTFFADLEERGYHLTFRAPLDVTPPIIEFGEPKFDHVILFSPESKKYAPDITPQSLLKLLSLGTNLLITLSPKQTPLFSLANEFSLILPPPETPLLSHFPARGGAAHTIPVSTASSLPSFPPSPVLARSRGGTVWFTGVPHAHALNPQVVPLLLAPAEGFAADSTSDADADAVVDASERAGEGLWAGAHLGLVSGFQTRLATRALWCGGLDMFSDRFMDMEAAEGVKSANRDFAKDVSAWVFQESLVLRIDSTTHHLVGESTPRDRYTVNDNLVFNAVISRWDPEAAAWQPYSGLYDLQLEFTMLDPHIRTALLPVPDAPGHYAVTFRAPDRHGVFKFVIDYKRKGWTYLQSSTTVAIVPPQHDGYARFLSAAWPYYAGAVSTSLGFVLFSAIWLGGNVRDMDRKGKKKAE